jgi:uncharacterized oligopeptide transporter (OPT) family protein
MDNFISYFSFDFALYVLRWIFSAFIMIIPLYLLNKYNITSQNNLKKFYIYKEYIDLIIVQIIGAFIFWWIDQIIFLK